MISQMWVTHTQDSEEHNDEECSVVQKAIKTLDRFRRPSDIDSVLIYEPDRIIWIKI